MDIESVAYALVHEFRGGAQALGAQAGIGGQLLNNKVNPNDTRHHLMLKEAVRIQQVSGDHRILQAMAEELGYVLVPTPEIAGDDDVTAAVLEACGRYGDYMREVANDWSDRQITENERRQLESKLAVAMAQLQHLQALLAGRSR